MPKANHIELIMTAIDYIESKLLADISVVDVCSQISMSPWQFQRLFRAYTGDSIGGYIRGRRLTLGAEKLLVTPDRILDIAIDLQFNSQEAFTRAFKDYFKVTPGEARQKNELLKMYKKKCLERSLLLHIQTGIQREPQIIEAGPFHLIGQQIEITSFLGEAPNFAEKVPSHWIKFNEIKGQIPHRCSKLNYGIAVSEKANMVEDSLIYLAAIDVDPLLKSDDKAIESLEVNGLTSLRVEKNTYAVFENIGLCDKSQDTINYIYGTWLPNSNYERASGYDFEVFDHRYSFDNPNSISNYYLPIKPVK